LPNADGDEWLNWTKGQVPTRTPSEKLRAAKFQKNCENRNDSGE
jgi:hypothetical protein